jgi:hypothetical protein
MKQNNKVDLIIDKLNDTEYYLMWIEGSVHIVKETNRIQADNKYDEVHYQSVCSPSTHTSRSEYSKHDSHQNSSEIQYICEGCLKLIVDEKHLKTKDKRYPFTFSNGAERVYAHKCIIHN